ncbi:MAG: hypothetical protein ACI94Y_003458 [Maribacter sp.]|jgi:hypothetical protein
MVFETCTYMTIDEMIIICFIWFSCYLKCYSIDGKYTINILDYKIYTQLNNVFRIGYVTHFVEDEAQNAGDALASASICNEVIS